MKTGYLTSEAERRYRKAYYEKNKDRILQKKKDKYAKDPNQYREQNKRYSMTHDRSEYFREYYRRKQERDVC